MSVRRWLGSPRIVLLAAALAGGLTLPSLGNGLGIDDHLYRARVLEGWDAGRSARDLFSFANPDRPDEVRRHMDQGELSWWAAPGLRWRFFRPLPLLLHHLEFKWLERGGAWLMHLHSVLWMAALAAVAAVLFRRLLEPGWVAGLAALLYAVDDGHGFAVGWLANRCMLMAAVLAIGTLLAHDAWRRRGWRAGAILAPLALALTLLCSEESLAIAGFLLAHVVVLDPVRGRRRLLVLAPYALVIGAWYLGRGALGYNIDGPGSYIDALREPVAFLALALQRFPIYAHGALGALPSDLWEVYFVRAGLTWVMVAAGVIFLALVTLVLAPLVRNDRLARFWALGGASALVPVCAAHPNDRHLFLVGLAGSALVARYLACWVDRSAPEQARRLPRRGPTVAAGCFVLVHAIAAPLLLPVRARIPGSVSRGLEHIDRLVPNDPALAAEHLVIVNVPFKYLCNLASVVRRSSGGVSPRSWHCLGVSDEAVAVHREGPRTLVLRPALGYLRHFEDTNVRSRLVPFAAGDRVSLPGLAITVREVTADGRPREVAFVLETPLEDSARRWLVFHDGGYRAFTPPGPGQTITLAGERFAWSDLLKAR